MIIAMPERKPSSKEKVIAGRYLIEKKLGSGGGGSVYLARDLSAQGQKVALKVVPLKKKQDPSMITALKNEFATLTLLHHRNLAAVYDFGVTGREMYFSSEWVDGFDILTASQGNTDLNSVFQLTVQILRAIDFLHRRGVLHLDLKPANILVTDPDRTGDLTVKLIDFGLAQWKKKGAEEKEDFFGTPPYQAPEIILHQAPSPASDIYSLGMICHQMFAQCFPFQSQEPFEIMREQIYGEPRKVITLNHALPDEFGDFLLKMVAKSPANRLSTPRQVLDGINQTLGENFSLRSKTAPIRILEESDYLFHQDLIDDLVTTFQKPESHLMVLYGPSGIGKTRLLIRVKELLQLKGIQPIHFRDLKAFRELLKNNQNTLLSPLFLDFPAVSRESLLLLLPELEKINLPLLITAEEPLTFPVKTSKALELKPLNEKNISGFLSSEIADFPLDKFQSEVLSACQGSPALLEKLLQAFREENLIQWGESGWRWMGHGVKIIELLPRQEARWQERLAKVQLILKSSSVGLNAKTLEGILGLEPGAMNDKLLEWSEKGLLHSQMLDGVPLYFPGSSTPTESASSPITDWKWAEGELQNLYDTGAFEAGVELATHLFSHLKDREKIPPRVSLIAARHWIAVGLGEDSLKHLPSPPPSDPKDLGLYYEIKSRIFFSFGDFKKAEEELKESEKAFKACNDLEGICRVHNMRGSIQKKLFDYEGAEKAFKAAVKKGIEAKNYYLEGLAMVNLATLYHDSGHYNRASETYTNADELAKKAKHPLLSCSLLHNWVNLLFSMGRISEAESACYEWLQLSIENRYQEHQATALNFLALLEARKNHKEMQLNYLNQAIGLANPNKAPQLFFQTLLNRGWLFWSMKKYTPAQLDAEAALKISEKRSFLFLATWAYNLMGKIYRDRPKPDLDKSGEYLQKAYEMVVKAHNRQALWEVEYDRGLLAKKLNQLKEARQFFLSAQKELTAVLQEMPENIKSSYLRDRKLDRIINELELLEGEDL
jgi:serine/threonine protein kinase